jgi:hypothetical protein
VNEPNIDILTTVRKFFGNLQKYKHNKLLEDMGIPGMTVKEFWQHSDKDYTKFKYAKSLVPKQFHVKLPWIMGKFHEWYYLSYVYGLNFIQAEIPRDILQTSDFDLHVKIAELHAIIASECSMSHPKI